MGENKGARENARGVAVLDPADSSEAPASILLFLKTADERSRPPYNRLISAQYAWPSLLARDGDGLFDHYPHTLEALDNQNGLP